MTERAFTLTLCFETKSANSEKQPRTYRNPIYLAKEYASKIEPGEAKSEADLARKLGISRARVNHFVRLLELDSSIIEAIENLGDPLTSQAVTDGRLRLIAGLCPNEQAKAAKLLLRKRPHGE